MGKQRRRKRRSFSPEFKAETVRLVQGSEKSLGTIGGELDLTETALRAWVRQAEVDGGRGRAGALTTDEREIGSWRLHLSLERWAGPAACEEIV